VRTRVAEVLGVPCCEGPTPAEARVVFEDLQTLRYRIGEHYHTHHDYFDPKVFGAYNQADGRNRFITVLFYLTDVEEGGETAFPMAGDPRPLRSYSDCSRGLRVRPQQGKAVIFYSLAPAAGGSLELDEASWHAGCDVARGTKWGANFWVTLKDVHPRHGKA
jgi:prolyl 4-hydroxylase